MAGNISRENGKKGGRKKGLATILAEQGRAMIAEHLKKHLPEILEALTNKALTGDVPATKELFDRAWGKSRESVELTGKDGEAIKIELSEAIAKKNNIK